MRQRTSLLLVAFIVLLLALVWTSWSTLLGLTVYRLPASTPVGQGSLPVGTRAAQLFWSERYMDLEKLLDQLLINAAMPDEIELALNNTCDYPIASRREAERWLAQRPTSLWPQLCLGRAYLQQGLQARGNEFSMNTPPEKIARMHRAFEDAYAQLAPSYNDAKYQRAVIVPLLTLLQFSGSASVGAAVGNYDSVYRAGVAAHPKMETLYAHRMNNLRPQWGGSINEMLRFVEEARKNGAPERVIDRLAATAAAAVTFEQWKGNPQMPASELEVQIGRDLGIDAYENLALDLDRIGSPIGAKRARDEAVRRYAEHTTPLVRRGYTLLKKGESKVAYRDFVEAANRGDYSALNKVIYTLAYGDDVLQKDSGELLKSWAEHGASIGHAMSEHVVGTLFLQGLSGVKPDHAKAIAFYQRSARHGYANGQHDLATLLLRAAKSDADKQEAVGWLQEAARQQHRFAREKLANMGIPYLEQDRRVN